MQHSSKQINDMEKTGFVNKIIDTRQQIEHSVHSYQRSSQRGIRTLWIKTVIQQGRVVYRQGYKFFFMTDKELCYYDPEMQERLRNLVVVLASDSNRVVTCYKNRNAVKRIKRKNKRLIKD